MVKKSFFSLVIALLVLFVILQTVSASSGAAQGSGPTAPDLKTFLQWLIGGGGSILAVSWALERMLWFQGLSPEQKDYTIFGLSGAVGCAALAIVTYVPASTLDSIAPYFLILASIFATTFIAKTFHKADK